MGVAQTVPLSLPAGPGAVAYFELEKAFKMDARHVYEVTAVGKVSRDAHSSRGVYHSGEVLMGGHGGVGKVPHDVHYSLSVHHSNEVLMRGHRGREGRRALAARVAAHGAEGPRARARQPHGLRRRICGRQLGSQSDDSRASHATILQRVTFSWSCALATYMYIVTVHVRTVFMHRPSNPPRQVTVTSSAGSGVALYVTLTTAAQGRSDPATSPWRKASLAGVPWLSYGRKAFSPQSRIKPFAAPRARAARREIQTNHDAAADG